MVWPRIQWLGSGLGHSGSTSNRGAVAVAAWTTFFFRKADPAPSAARTAANVAPTYTSPFIVPSLGTYSGVHRTTVYTSGGCRADPLVHGPLNRVIFSFDKFY